MDTLDARLIAERARLVALLSGLARALSELEPDQLAEVLPMIAGPVDDATRRVRALGVRASVPYAAASLNLTLLTGPLAGAGVFGNPE